MPPVQHQAGAETLLVSGSSGSSRGSLRPVRLSHCLPVALSGAHWMASGAGGACARGLWRLQGPAVLGAGPDSQLLGLAAAELVRGDVTTRLWALTRDCRHMPPITAALGANPCG